MKFQVWCALFGLFFGYTLAVEWYETASFYQIYPQSFFDDGTGRKGFGSLKGIQSKLPYLKNLGIDCIWLNPIFESKSFRAFGYDITNYKEIDPRYGSISDFDALVKAVHDQNMKIIVDFVPNHCAFDNPLFSDSTKNVNGKDDWFVWTKTAKISDTVVPPSNWKTIDGKNTAWISMDNKTKIKEGDVLKDEMAFYYAQFGQSMPDFNLRKAEVVAYLEEVMKFWLDKGVDGFRIDAVSHFFEALPDSTTNKYENEPTNDAKPGELLHTKTQDLDETFQLIYKWRKFLDDYSTNTKTDKKIMMTESYSSPDIIKKFYGDATNNGSHLPFNFEFISKLKKDSKASDIVNIVTSWYQTTSGRITNWAIGNHDNSRVATRFGNERIDIMNILVTMLKGTSVTYYGEEIGMVDSCATYDDNRELNGKACDLTANPAPPLTDAWYRSPMQWNNDTNAGFSTHTETWLPVASNYKELNVKAQEGKEKSHLEIYKRLMLLRKHNALKFSEKFGIKTLGTNSFGFTREFNDKSKQSVFVLINYGSTNETIKIKEAFPEMPDSMIIEIATDKSSRKQGEQLSVDGEVILAGYEALVLYYNNSITLTISNIILIFAVFVRLILV